MANTGKNPSAQDGTQVLQTVFNAVDGSLATSGFLTSKVGHKIELAISTTTASNDTQTYTFKDGSTTLYVLRFIYTDNTYETLVSAERIS